MAALRLLPAALCCSAAAAAAAPPSSSFPSTVSYSLRSIPSLRLPSLRLASRHPHRPRRPRRPRRGPTMMDTAASSYANALADVARKNGSLEATIADMEKVEKVFADPEVQSFFANPTVAAKRKADVVNEIAASCELLPHTANFLNILVDMRRIDIVKEIVKEFEGCYNRITNTEVAVVSSVVALEPQHLAQIAQAIQRLTGAKNVRIKTVLNPSLIAGFTIRYGPSGSKFIDLSVKRQLDEIASQLDFSSISLVQ